MLKRRVRPKSGIREEVQIRCPSHLKWVRGHECAAFNSECNGRIEAAHARWGTDGGMGLKPSDSWAIPLCSKHHGEQHNTGELTFQKRHCIDMKKIAQELWAKSPHRFKAENK